MSRKHVIILGRLSEAIAGGILSRFGGISDLRINRPGNVIQSRVGTFGDGESIFELFAEGKLSDHPVEQNLTDAQRRELREGLKGAHVTFVHSISGDNTSSRATSLVHGVRHLKMNLGVESVTLIAPHLPFMRNDREFRKTVRAPDGSEVTRYQDNAVSCEQYAWQLKVAGVDRVIGFEPHSRDGVKIYRSHFGEKDAQFVNTGAFFAGSVLGSGQVLDRGGNIRVMIGAPDGLNKPGDFGIMRAMSLGREVYRDTPYGDVKQKANLRSVSWMFGIHKERIDEKHTRIVDFHGDVAGKDCYLIDDIISSGGTIVEAAAELKERGARQVIVLATHGVLVNGALKRLLESPFIDRLCLTDSIPGVIAKAEAQDVLDNPKLVIRSVAPLAVHEIEKDHAARPDLEWPYATGTANVAVLGFNGAQAARPAP